MLATKTRADKEQVEQRVNELLHVMLDGAQKWDFLQFVREREADPTSPWHVGDGSERLTYSQIRRYVGKAKTLISQSGRGERQELIARHIAIRQHLFAKANSQGDVKAALACAESEARLQGLFPQNDDKRASTINIQQNYFGMTPEQFAALPTGDKMRLLKGG